jgi:hypothetical protein
MVERLSSANTFEPLVERRYHNLTQAIGEIAQGGTESGGGPLAKGLLSQTALRMLGTMNVAYVMGSPADGPGTAVYRSPYVSVHRNPHALPRAYAVCRARSAASPEEALRTLAGPDFDPSQEVVLEAHAPGRAVADGGPGVCDARPTTEREGVQLLPSASNQVTIEAVLSQPGYLVLADTFYPGWQVHVDGHRAEILRANYAMRAVALSPGEHTVVFRYRPASFLYGAAISGAAWVALGAVWLIVRAGKRTGRKQDR